MATVHPFDNRESFTRIHNYIFDHIMPAIKPNAFKVLLFIIRKTKGWGKNADRLSYSQLRDGTGIKSDSTLSTAIKELEELKYITIEKADGVTNNYVLNTTLEIVVVDDLYTNCSATSTKTVEVTSTKTVDTKETTKETIQKKEEPPTPLPSKGTTGDPLMDAAKAKFENRNKGNISSWQAELNLELAANQRLPLANRLAEIWKMKKVIDAGNDRANKTCQEVAIRLYRLGVKDIDSLNVHYNAYLADDWRRKNNPNPKPERLEEFISQSLPDQAMPQVRQVGVSGDLGFSMNSLRQGAL